MDQADQHRFFSKKKPEKLVIILDCTEELGKVDCLNEAQSFSNKSRFAHLKRGIEMLMRAKSHMSSSHEFSLFTLDSVAQAVVPFTNSPENVMEILSQIEPYEVPGSCDLNTVFEELKDSIRGSDELPYVIHIILFYGRSSVVPNFTEFNSLSHPDIFFDVLYVHESSNINMDVYETFRSIQSSNEQKNFYLFEVNNDVNRFYHSTSLLTAHVQQRLPQNKLEAQLEAFKKK